MCISGIKEVMLPQYFSKTQLILNQRIRKEDLRRGDAAVKVTDPLNWNIKK